MRFSPHPLPNAKVAGGLYRPTDIWLPVSSLLGLDRETLDLMGPGAKISAALWPSVLVAFIHPSGYWSAPLFQDLTT